MKLVSVLLISFGSLPQLFLVLQIALRDALWSASDVHRLAWIELYCLKRGCCH
jgi:hypothetical protein